MLLKRDILDLVEKELFLRQLKKKERQFVEIYLTVFDLKKTCQLCGMRYLRGFEWLQKPHIQQAIEYGQEIISRRNRITQDYFVTKLKEIIEDTRTKPSDKISALGLLARVTGHIKDTAPEQKQLVVLRQVSADSGTIEVSSSDKDIE